MSELAILKEPIKTYDEYGKWIPCSERLPSSSGKCLVTEGAEQKTTSIGYFSAEHKRFYSAMDVIAWMPLPAPYTEKEVRPDCPWR